MSKPQWWWEDSEIGRDHKSSFGWRSENQPGSRQPTCGFAQMPISLERPDPWAYAKCLKMPWVFQRPVP